MPPSSAFKAYDIRGQIPAELNAGLAYRIGQSAAAVLKPGHAVVGHDMRQDSPALAHALIQGLLDSGTDVSPLGLCGTEEVYFHTAHSGAGVGLMVTASHNPESYNGIKLIGAGGAALSRDNGLAEMEERVYGSERFPAVAGFAARGRLADTLSKEPYVARLLQAVEGVSLKPFRIVAHPGNGCAGPVIDLLERFLPIEWVRVDFDPDPRLPNGVPNPLLPEKRAKAADAVRAHGADLGLAWDGDFDRCFFYDHEGSFIEGYYLVGLIAAATLDREPGAAILYDPRLTWNTEEIVRERGGRAVACKTGHAFFKQAMRRENAAYGGEMSAHHYFRSFYACDTGMLPWLAVLAEMSRTNATLRELVGERMQRFPCSGEINFTVPDARAAVDRVAEAFMRQNPAIMDLDGLGMAFDDWRFNLRASNTEPLLRLNVESRGDPALVARMVERISGLIQS